MSGSKIFLAATACISLSLASFVMNATSAFGATSAAKDASSYRSWLTSEWTDSDAPYIALRKNVNSKFVSNTQPLATLKQYRVKALQDPNNPEAWFSYAYAAYKVKCIPGYHFDEAVSVARDEFREAVTASKGKFPRTHNFARVACLIGTYATSQIDIAKRLLAAAPHDDDIRLALAVMLCRTDAPADMTLAESYSDALQSRHPNDESVLLLQELIAETKAYTASDKVSAQEAYSFYEKAKRESPAQSGDRIFITSAQQRLKKIYDLGEAQSSQKVPSAKAQTQKLREIYCDWFSTPWTENDSPYSRIRTRIDRAITLGQSPKVELKTFQAVSDGSSKTLFAIVYSAYKLAETPGNAYDPDVESTFSMLSYAIIHESSKAPHTYNVMRLAFLGAPYFDKRIVKTGRELLQKDPNDIPVENRLAQVLNWSGSPEDRRLASKYANDILRKRPNDPLTYLLLGNIAYKNAVLEHSKSEANRCISIYKTALTVLPPNSGDITKIKSFIKYVEMLPKRWSESGGKKG